MRAINIIPVLILLLIWSCQKGEEIAPDNYQCDNEFQEESLNHPENERFQALLDEMTASGVVGVEMAVWDPVNGIWVGASGKADLHNRVDLKPCNLTRFGSVVKIFTSTVVFKLHEEGKINLDDKISKYLQGDVIRKINNADKATIRELLHHSSGIFNYIHNLHFQTASLNNLIRKWDAYDLLEYAYQKAPYFAPGNDVEYSNTNYIMLGLLIEKLEGKPLYQVFDEKIFIPNGMKNTQFAGKNPVPNGIIRGYIDLYSNLQVIESTYFSGWDYYTADGGLISNAYDINMFVRMLMGGKVLSASSLSAMMDWKAPREQDPDFYDIEYGLGVFRMVTKGGECYFHSGDAIGYYANVLYFPSDGTTVAYAVNSNYGKIDQFVSTKEAIAKIIAVVRK